VRSSNPGLSNIPTRGSNSRRPPQRQSTGPATFTNLIGDAAGIGARIAAAGDINTRRLIGDQQYFGLEAKALRTGAARTLARISTRPPEQASIDIRNIGDDFHLDAPASAALLSALLAGGLLYPDGAGRYHPTRLFREHALATIVAPLARERAKGLIDRACSLAARVNSEWKHSPFQIEMMAISGSYMTRRDQLSDVLLSLALHRRPDARVPHSGIPPSKDEVSRQIVESLSALSSFIVVRFVSDQTKVQRPFSVVFRASTNVIQSPADGGWDKLRDWSASVTRWFAAK
jgi:hypothetical protein